MSLSDFDALTVYEFSVIFKKHAENMKMLDRRTGRICATVMNAAIQQINIQLKKKDRIKKGYTEEDFMPKPPKPPMTNEQMIAMGEMICAAFGGEDRRTR